MVHIRRCGAHLSEERRKQYESIMNKIIENQTAFSVNLAEEKLELVFTRDQLAGVPESTLATLGRKGDDYIVTMKYPDVFGVLDNCSVSDTRRQVLTCFNNRGGQANLSLLAETIELRKKAAQILGYPDYPSYALENSMAETPSNVKQFLFDLRSKLEASGRKELEELRKFKEECGEEGPMQPWDFNYYIKKLKEKLYHVDDNLIKEYFPTDHVVSEMLKIYQEIFGLKFNEYLPQISLIVGSNTRTSGSRR